ncbi:alpha/beta fold hydrolase [Actinomycetes bacterium KLBMP 9759]
MPALPRLDPIGRPSADPAALVLVLHGGRANSTESGEPKRLAYRRMLPFARALARRPELDVHLLRYRVRGWNAPRKDAQRDAEWGVAELAERHPGRPVVLVGHSMGGRAALGAAGAPAVTAVCALAPWLDDSDPVDQLAGRSVLIAHGNRERWTSPRASYEYALRAAAVTDRIARFDVHGAGHFMITRSSDWHGLVRRFVMGVTGLEPEDRDIANAMRQPAPGGLRVALAAGRRPGADP